MNRAPAGSTIAAMFKIIDTCIAALVVYRLVQCQQRKRSLNAN